MPYTPPAVRSPAGSRPHTPRSNSFSQKQQQPPQTHAAVENGSKKDPSNSPTSKTYLSKHRRSPTISESGSINVGTITAGAPRPQYTNVNDRNGSSPANANGTSSPPSDKADPLDDSMGSPSGSPPSSSDEEPNSARGRNRNVTNLAELQAAIRNIEQHREGSPTEQMAGETEPTQSTAARPAPPDASSVETNGTNGPENSMHPPLSATARKISHSRSSTDASAFIDFPRKKFDSPARSASISDLDDEEDEEDLKDKPALIRKKSGELVRPALRASSMRRRPSSMPGTPTYSKAVHFQDNSLEHVRHFLQVDRPIAVSAGSSPVEVYDDDTEFPFGEPPKSVATACSWDIKLPNFPQNPLAKLTYPVKVEKVFLSADSKILIGAIAVRNLAFHKLVVARFTLDYWKTTSEVKAEYNNDVRRKYANDGYDRFTFNVHLEDQANLENKTLFFCIRYSVNGQEYWDNNGSHNYQVDFAKKHKPQRGKNSGQINNLPRSKPNVDFSPKIRPRSMPSFDDFANSASPYDFSNFPHPSSMVGESPIRFRNKPSARSAAPDASGKSKGLANQQAFGNRYDFGASLSAAIQAASKEMGDKSPQQRRSPPDSAPMVEPQSVQGPGNVAGLNQPAKSTSTTETSKPSALTAEKPSLQSPSYNELLDKYCFFGSGKATASPPKTRSAPSQVDDTATTVPKPPPPTPASTASRAESTVSSPPRATSPVEERSSKSSSSRASRSASPATGPPLGSRTASPGAFGYSYHQRMQAGFFETQTPTAIHG